MADRFPWFPLYVADWRLSQSVRSMTLEQRGAFLELLIAAWGDGTAEPSLPADDAKLAQFSELGKRWTKYGAQIRACFTERGGRLFNTRLSHVWEVQRAKYDFATAAGKASAAQRALQRKANGGSTGVAKSLPRKPNHTDADTDRTKSSSGPTLVGAEVNGALASLRPRPA